MQVSMRDIVITAIDEEADGIRSFRLESTDGEPFAASPAGAHIDIHLPDGLVRQYSLCNDPAETNFYRIAIKRETQSRGGSQWFHEAAHIGAKLKMGASRSLLSVSSKAERHILLAGGIGITPLYSMAMHFLTAGKPFELHYFAHSKERAAFFEVLSSGAFADHVHFHFGLETAALAPVLDGIFAQRGSGSHLYMCGPGPFMDHVRTQASRLWAETEIHEERFSGAAAPENADSFRVVLARSGTTIDVPTNRSILDVLMANGHDIEHSCEQGFCGSCMTALLEGEAEHRDTFLTPEEIASGQWIMPCVSRAKTAQLTLDL
ncbi:oxidoreductase [Rhizobium sp. CG4]|jgi:vanillate O-demethylase ferredoxin subunit|uniref:PDR/VanB family oxidoreductase n=1 Tax=Rhizobium sp. CG4 TaxID=2726075 RepID=UPI00203413AA|nr:PDR/VanB family oxidoreductase [Rhizobium sp. CG4]MCM2457866.1 oxidoreductase [Rhizobium sp. CG4]